MEIDARLYHAPANPRYLIDTATRVTGTRVELAARLGVGTRSLRDVYAGRAGFSYTMQVAIEQIIANE